MLLFIAIYIISLNIIVINGECNYIRRNNIAYPLNQCSFTSTLSTPISWGFYCNEQDDGKYIAEYRQWNAAECDVDGDNPDITLFQIDCNGDEDNCDCSNEFSECSVATLTIDNCGDNNEQYQVTKRIYELCEQGIDSSQQLVCEDGNNLKRMQYENNECQGYGFQINSDEFDNKDITPSNNASQAMESSQICSMIECTSSSLRIIYSNYLFVMTMIITLFIMNQIII